MQLITFDTNISTFLKNFLQKLQGIRKQGSDNSNGNNSLNRDGISNYELFFVYNRLDHGYNWLLITVIALIARYISEDPLVQRNLHARDSVWNDRSSIPNFERVIHSFQLFSPFSVPNRKIVLVAKFIPAKGKISREICCELNEENDRKYDFR